MRAYTRTLAKGDAVDRQISRVLQDFCSHSFSCHSYADFGSEGELTGREKKDKYKEALETELVTYLPFVKLGSGKYLIGTSEKQLHLKGRACLVRTAGGHVELAEYLKKQSRPECIELSTLIRNGDGSLLNTVISILKQHKADKESVARWEQKCTPEMAQHFDRLID